MKPQEAKTFIGLTVKVGNDMARTCLGDHFYKLTGVNDDGICTLRLQFDDMAYCHVDAEHIYLPTLKQWEDLIL